MRKIRTLIFVSVVLLFTNGVWAQNSFIDKFEIGANLTYNLGLGAICEHENGNMALGVNAYYPLLNLKLVKLGVSGCAEIGGAVGKKDYVDSWFVLNALGGIYTDITIKQIVIRPEVDFGMALNIVNSNARNVHGAQTDTLIRGGCSVIWQPDFMKNFAFYSGINYSMMPEKENIGNFLGFKLGIIFRKNNSAIEKIKVNVDIDREGVSLAEEESVTITEEVSSEENEVLPADSEVISESE